MEVIAESFGGEAILAWRGDFTSNARGRRGRRSYAIIGRVPKDLSLILGLESRPLRGCLVCESYDILAAI